MNQWKNVIIHIRSLSFLVEFPNHRADEEEFRKNPATFVQGNRAALPSVSGLELDSFPSTEPLSCQRQTPRTRPFYFDDGEIGRGLSGRINRLINMREGIIYAAKIFARPKPPPPNNKKRALVEDEWLEKVRNEVMLMKDNSHPNIMKVIEFREEPEPFLLMPYYPLGSLDDYRGIDSAQYVSASRQMLLALRYLHGHKVAHRDLKPANLILAKLHPFTIIVSDLGFSKTVPTDELLMTFCGTLLYAAPEVYPVDRKAYGTGYGLSADMVGWCCNAGIYIRLSGL